MTLREAAELFLGDARRVPTLRSEIKKGNLVTSFIGRTYWVRWSALLEMEARCQGAVQVQNSGSTKNDNPGQSLTADPVIAQGAALRTLRALRESYGTISRPSIDRLSRKRRC